MCVCVCVLDICFHIILLRHEHVKTAIYNLYLLFLLFVHPLLDCVKPNALTVFSILHPNGKSRINGGTPRFF